MGDGEKQMVDLEGVLHVMRIRALAYFEAVAELENASDEAQIGVNDGMALLIMCRDLRKLYAEDEKKSEPAK